jgi:hypothetical protein
VAPLLDADDSLLAASAWNDNGVEGYVHDSEALYRSDFFPGLGWMISRCVCVCVCACYDCYLLSAALSLLLSHHRPAAFQ